MPCDLMQVITGNRHSELGQCVDIFSRSRAPTFRKFTCTLKFKDSQKNVKARINAIIELCSDKQSRWHEVLLNHEYSELPTRGFETSLHNYEYSTKDQCTVQLDKSCSRW